jgi:PleD family two-component response regulator
MLDPSPVTLSIGSVAGNAIGAPVLNGEQLLRTADTALYCAKTNGRNRVKRAPDLSSSASAAQQ